MNVPIFKNKMLMNSLLFLVVLAALGVSVAAIIETTKKKEGFHFEAPLARCRNGSYTWGAKGSELRNYCESIPPSILNSQQCGVGFQGKPIHWERSSLSNDKWENDVCDDKKVYNGINCPGDYPCPL